MAGVRLTVVSSGWRFVLRIDPRWYTGLMTAPSVPFSIGLTAEAHALAVLANAGIVGTVDLGKQLILNVRP